ncbi:hypothetical protein HMPREF1548_04856 [Clostridium sp. KLE 1755]|nr:hypothetical protein HMPREF1548_04856 [Clostridium sp. KLE 1755]
MLFIFYVHFYPPDRRPPCDTALTYPPNITQIPLRRQRGIKPQTPYNGI